MGDELSGGYVGGHPVCDLLLEYFVMVGLHGSATEHGTKRFRIWGFQWGLPPGMPMGLERAERAKTRLCFVSGYLSVPSLG